MIAAPRPRLLRRAVLLAALLLALGAGRPPRPAPPDLGSLAERLPAAPLLLIAPSARRAADALRPLADRLALALPDLDPARQFVEWRVRLGLDPWDPASLEAAGLDPTGPLAIVDDGALLQPVLLARLLPDGLARFREAVVARVVAREGLVARHARAHGGIEAEGHAIADDADPRFAYAVDGAVLALAPVGCGRDLSAVVHALQPRRRALQDRVTRAVLAGLPDGALLGVLQATAMPISPFATARRTADAVQATALSLDVVAEHAVLAAQVLPSETGRRRLGQRQPLQGAAARQVRRVGALSLWTGLDRAAAVPAAWPYAAALEQAAAAQGLALGRELHALADGGAGWHLLDLEPLLPGLTAQRSVDAVSTAFFVEHALTVPLRSAPRAGDLLARLDRWLGQRGGQLSPATGTDPRTYAEGGRVLEYGVVEAQLVATSGPGSLAQLRGVLGEPGEAVAEGTLFALRAEGPSLRAVLGRVGLLGAGDNNDLRALWALRQAAAPLLARLGELRADLRRADPLWRLDARAELTGSVAPAPAPGGTR